jgi:NAD(P)-dependent dehydrogenase (short-subunit alcohol dehydrogenase family)
LQRFATPAEVAHLIVYLASPLAAVTNGAAVRAEGGILSTVV